MIDLFIEGGIVFMGLLTLVLLTVFILGVRQFIIIKNSRESSNQNGIEIGLIRKVGLFGMVLGIFAQLRGLYQMFDAIQEINNVSPALLAGGLKVSMISTEYGVIIFLISYLIWFGLKALIQTKTHA